MDLRCKCYSLILVVSFSSIVHKCCARYEVMYNTQSSMETYFFCLPCSNWKANYLTEEEEWNFGTPNHKSVLFNKHTCNTWSLRSHPFNAYSTGSVFEKDRCWTSRKIPLATKPSTNWQGQGFKPDHKTNIRYTLFFSTIYLSTC